MKHALLIFIAACGVEPSTYYGDLETDPQLPPRGMDAIEPWLDAKYHDTWHCEPEVRPEMPGSPHDAARVCSNDVLAAADPALIPVGAATVKEIYTAGKFLGHAVSRKVTDEGPAGWYWYEFHSNRLFTDGMNTGSCPECHMSAVSEFTFVIVRE